ncbi:hypothetical protein SAMN02745866_02977 [Alteromonadaceae bacterium Bs31]|nr:hypothetical protein SAMN02745866_02977 [Alteromonadaceae bacterium Bs31]
MRIFIAIFFSFVIAGCSGQHYYVRQDDPNRNYKVVYEDEILWLALHPMNGSNSSLMFSSRAEYKEISVKIQDVSLSVIADGKSVEPVSTTFNAETVILNRGEIYSMVAKYNFSAPPEFIKARLQLTASSSGSEISIDEVVKLEIVEYGFWGALMSI